MFASSKISEAVAEQPHGQGWRDRVLARPVLARTAELMSAAVRRSKAEMAGLQPARHPAAHDSVTRWETFYAGGYDPFGYRTSGYEQRKFDLTMACLPRARYRNAYEPGCSIGELSERLAARCDHLLAADVSQQAVDRARTRLQGFANVDVARHDLPAEHPVGPFDLVLLSEIGYYLPKATLDALLERTVASLEPGGHLVAVHGRGISPEIFKPGDIVHRRILLTRGLRRIGGYREPAFRIDLFARR